MSQISVNDISSLDGKSGPVISGITTVSSTGYMQVPVGDTRTRIVLPNENIVTDGLVLYLDAGKAKSFGGDGTTWRDLSGENINGTLTNGVGFTEDYGGSLIFDGVDDYVQTNKLKVSDSKNFTVEVFVNPETTQNSYANILDYDHTNGGFTIQQSAASTNYFGIAYQYSSIGPLYYESTPILISAGQWNHLVFTKNDDQIIGYLNGQKQFDDIGNINVVNLFDRIVHIGKWISGSRFFYGKISIAKIYDRALTASEVLQNYEATKYRYEN